MILSGNSYHERLWCIWELCTLYACSFHHDFLNRIYVLAKDKNAEMQFLTNITENFSVANACCFNKNEEKRLKRVIESIDTDVFIDNVKKLGEIIKEREMRELDNKYEILESINGIRRRLSGFGDSLKSFRSSFSRSSFSSMRSTPRNSISIHVDKKNDNDSQDSIDKDSALTDYSQRNTDLQKPHDHVSEDISHGSELINKLDR